MIRPATADDISALVEIENRLHHRPHLPPRVPLSDVESERGDAGVDGEGGGSAATPSCCQSRYVARASTPSPSTPIVSGTIGSELLAAAEPSRASMPLPMRLEVRADADKVQAFYRAQGFRKFKLQPHYEDDVAAVRMEKSLAPPPDPSLMRVPYYAQTLDFTCGPAAVLMAMRALDPVIPLDQTTEIRLWRRIDHRIHDLRPRRLQEGVGAGRAARGFAVELFLGDRSVMFVDSVRSPLKREVIRLVRKIFGNNWAPAAWGGIPTVVAGRHAAEV
jgi:hypothetical protein